jgi:hypothetical protein
LARAEQKIPAIIPHRRRHYIYVLSSNFNTNYADPKQYQYVDCDLDRMRRRRCRYVSPPPTSRKQVLTRIVAIAGRVGLQAFKRYKAGGAAGAIGKSFYKGGFENRMNRREAALVLQLRYDLLGGGGALR